MASPRPVPRGFVEWNGSKILVIVSGGMPGPLSWISRRTFPDSRRVTTSDQRASEHAVGSGRSDRLDRILEQVEKNLPQLRGISTHTVDRRVELRLEADASSLASRHRSDLFHGIHREGVEIELLEARNGKPREGVHVAKHPFEAAYFVDDDSKISIEVRTRRSFAKESVGESADDSQRIADFVRELGADLADSGELLRAQRASMCLGAVERDAGLPAEKPKDFHVVRVDRLVTPLAVRDEDAERSFAAEQRDGNEPTRLVDLGEVRMHSRVRARVVDDDGSALAKTCAENVVALERNPERSHDLIQRRVDVAAVVVVDGE